MPKFQFDLDLSQIIDPETQKEIVSNKSFFRQISEKKTKHKLFNQNRAIKS